MPTEAEIEVAFAAIDKANEETSGLSFSELLRNFARVALEAAERERARFRLENCQHPNKQGSGMICSDGSGESSWWCPACGKSATSKWPARPPEIAAAPLLWR